MSKAYDPATVKALTAMVGSQLGSWGMGPGASSRLLNLSENATFLASDPQQGREIVIRVQRPGYSSDAAIRSELAWISALKDEGVIYTAAPVKNTEGGYICSMHLPSGEPRVAVAFEKLNGHEPDLNEQGLAHWFYELGKITARMHRQARAWKRPEWFTRRRWDFAGLLGPRAYWGPWQASWCLDGKGRVIMQEAFEVCKEAADAFGTAPDDFGVIHADLRATNLLVDGDKLQVIDFDDMGFGWYLFDFAAALSFMEQDVQAPGLAHAWVEGYEEVRRLTRREKDMLPIFSIMRRLELSAWCASHSEVPFCTENGARVTHDTVRLCGEFLKGQYLKGI